MKIIITPILLFVSLAGISQEIPRDRYLIKTFSDEILGPVWMQIDTVIGDTMVYHLRSGRYVKKSREGVLLIDGHKWGGMTTTYGCEPMPHGYWIERYRNGELKEQGRYFCGQKTGTWIHYYENGQISKVENRVEPYLEMLTRPDNDWGPLKRYSLLEGPYLEYYPSGQLKIEGTYEIVEEYATTDTIFTANPETYEKIAQIIEGEFWIPRSKKSRVWNYYSENGAILSHEIYAIKTGAGEKIRSIESRYWEIFKAIFNTEKNE